jgi:hypothetical protein
MGGARWIGQSFMAAFIAMVFIYIIKKVALRYEIPIVKEIAEGV